MELKIKNNNTNTQKNVNNDNKHTQTEIIYKNKIQHPNDDFITKIKNDKILVTFFGRNY